MKLPIAWLRDYIDVDLSSDDIAARFALLGFPVDGIERRPKLSGVAIGRLTRVEKHPAADRLQVCTVEVNGPRSLTIATAAGNVAVGQIVPVATIGARLVGLTIGPRTMRGIESEGMLCSAEELGLEPAWFDDGILQLEDTLEIGADFVDMFRLSDDVLDVEVTANRVDALSIVGLARELAASLGRPIHEPPTEVERYHTVSTPDAAVVLESADCKRFVAQRFSDVRVRTAPFWMRVRLALAGQRPIDNLVDVSNFVMLETAQPLHFYDFESLAGGRLIVRDARPGERMSTLDGAERLLDERFLVIADDVRPQCVAGLMGAATSEVSPATRELLVEAATFSGPRIRRMSSALGLRTEASSRHEKGLPLGLAAWGAARAAHLLQLEGATVHAPFAAGASDEPAAPIVLPLSRIATLLGIAIGEREAESGLRHLGFSVHAKHDRAGSAILEVTPPRWRGDVHIPEDVVEEVARVAGYERIEAVVPPVFGHDVPSAEYRDEMRVAHELVRLGYREAITFSLQPASVRQTFERAGIALPGPVVEIANPLSEDQRYLRFSLLPGLLALAAKHAGAEAYRAFEIGRVFEGDAEPFETPGAAWLLALPRADEPAWRDSGFLTFKGDALALVRALAGEEAEAVSAALPGWHPGKTATLVVRGKDVAAVGALDPRLVAAYDIDARVYAGWMRLGDLPAYRVPRYVAGSKYPPVSRDLALVVSPDTPAMDIVHAVRAGGDGAIADVHVFDEYRGPQVEAGKKSIAVRVVLQRPDATLTDADADRHIAAIVASLRERCDAKVRE
jgi:phenylalanyl-tRNA synthetase beta chain